MPDPGIMSSQTKMPPFNALGLLLGGRGYASGWFQQRDRLAIADAALAKERADRGTFAQTMLADPRWKQYLANPNDRGAQGNLWGLMYGGPESAANLGSTLLSQGVSAIQSRELAGLQNTYQQQQQQQAHQFSLDLQTHATDEALRLDQQQMQQKLQFQQKAADYIGQVGQDGKTPEQNQYAINQIGDTAAPGQRKQGYDWAVSNGQLIGQVPQRGTPERATIEAKGNAYSNVSSLAKQMLWELDKGQVDRGTWNQRIDLSLANLATISGAGVLGDQERAFYQSVFPSYADTLKPDVLSQKKERLRALSERMDRDLNQYAASTLVPLSTYTADDWRAPQIPAPPVKSPLEMRQPLQQRLDQISPQEGVGAAQGRPVPAITGGGVERGPSSLNFEETPAQRRARFQKQKEELQRKFPKAKY